MGKISINQFITEITIYIIYVICNIYYDNITDANNDKLRVVKERAQCAECRVWDGGELRSGK